MDLCHTQVQDYCLIRNLPHIISDCYAGSGKKTSRISNGSYKQTKKDTEKILLSVNNKYDAILHYLVLKMMSGKCRPPLLTH
jgi:hypothetical protein